MHLDLENLNTARRRKVAAAIFHPVCPEHYKVMHGPTWTPSMCLVMHQMTSRVIGSIRHGSRYPKDHPSTTIMIYPVTCFECHTLVCKRWTLCTLSAHDQSSARYSQTAQCANLPTIRPRIANPTRWYRRYEILRTSDWCASRARSCRVNSNESVFARVSENKVVMVQLVIFGRIPLKFPDMAHWGITLV